MLQGHSYDAKAVFTALGRQKKEMAVGPSTQRRLQVAVQAALAPNSDNSVECGGDVGFCHRLGYS
jgi:hypothetical protein